MKKNIMVIDDSALMRRLISDIINSDERFQVLSLAHDGQEGLDILIKNHLKYDAIILDINMPKMNGLELLEKIDKYNIRCKVIVVSTVAIEGAKETIRALELGAFDFVTKPGSFIEAKQDNFKNKVLKSLEVATGATYDNPKKVNKTIVSPKPVVKPESSRTVIKNKFVHVKSGYKLIALACSTGGPKALQQIIPKLPANLDCPVLIVQHMPAGFTKSLADRLNELSQVSVKEAQHGEIIKKGVVYIAKGGYQMRVIKAGSNEYKLSVTEEAARGGLKPCADIMYESLLDCNIDELTCVVLTGMGSDGTSGIKQLSKQKNIYVIAQDKDSSVVYGMPKMVYESGLTNEVVTLGSVADAMVKNVGVY